MGAPSGVSRSGGPHRSLPWHPARAQAGDTPWLSDLGLCDRRGDGWSLDRFRMSTRRDTSPSTHQPEPPALGHAHGHGELAVRHVQHGPALTHHQDAAAVGVWAEGGIGVAWRGKDRPVSPPPNRPPWSTAFSRAGGPRSQQGLGPTNT